MKKQIAFVLIFLLLAATPCFSAYSLTVVRVIDGRSLELSNGERVRLIGIRPPGFLEDPKDSTSAQQTGINTQPLEAQKKLAAEFTRQLVKGRKIRLEYDINKRDRFGWTLAYLYFYIDPKESLNISPDWYIELEGNMQRVFVNATVMRAGYAKVKTVPPNVKYEGVFVAEEQRAREQKRGLWGAPALQVAVVPR